MGMKRRKNQLESNEKVTNRDLFRMAFRSCFLQASYNYERMQAGGWLYSLIPALRRVSKTRDELAERMLRHLDFFNTHPFISTTILGIIAAMEEKRQEVDSIRAIRTAMMGPFGGIGDARSEERRVGEEGTARWAADRAVGRTGGAGCS